MKLPNKMVRILVGSLFLISLSSVSALAERQKAVFEVG
jgi:hypothetical protein